MIRFFASILFLSASAFALPPIEGGQNAPLDSFDYVDFVRLDLPAMAKCSSTKVSPTFILTAAHCVIQVKDGVVTEVLSVGKMISGQGKIVKITVHPSYLSAIQEKSRKKITLYDVAFIEVEERPSKRTQPYPEIISASSKLGARKKMEMAGYGSNQARWNGKEYEYDDLKYSLQIGNNSWSECPLDYFGNGVEALAQFNQDMHEHMKVKAKRFHTISSGQETIKHDENGMVLPGDSGSPSIEKDVNGKMVVTGVASNLLAYGNDTDEASMEIEVDGKVVANQELKELPENWGYRYKSDGDFPVIQQKLKELGLVDDLGQPKMGVVVKRKYTRISEGNYSDLAHPENQKFIKSVMGK